MNCLLSVVEDCDGILCDNQCHPFSIRCNGYSECSDGYDEDNCPEPEEPSTTTTTTTTTEEIPRVFFFANQILHKQTIEISNLLTMLYRFIAQNTSVQMKRFALALPNVAMEETNALMVTMNTVAHVS